MMFFLVTTQTGTVSMSVPAEFTQCSQAKIECGIFYVNRVNRVIA